jgi:hypothetical protein
LAARCIAEGQAGPVGNCMGSHNRTLVAAVDGNR